MIFGECEERLIERSGACGVAVVSAEPCVLVMHKGVGVAFDDARIGGVAFVEATECVEVRGCAGGLVGVVEGFEELLVRSGEVLVV